MAKKGRDVAQSRKSVWKTTLTDTPTTDEEGVGSVRIEQGPLGERKFRWVKCEQTGGFTAGDWAMYATNWGGVTISVINGINSQLTVVASSALSFVQSTIGTDATPNAFVDDFIVITSALAGAAPELEMRKIRGNTTNRFFVATDFSAKPLTLDGFYIVRPYVVVDAATASSGGRVAGVAMADAAVADYLWVQTKGIHQAAKVNTLVQTVNAPFVVGPTAGEVASLVSDQAASINIDPPQIIGHFITDVKANLASLLAPVYVDID